MEQESEIMDSIKDIRARRVEYNASACDYPVCHFMIIYDIPALCDRVEELEEELKRWEELFIQFDLKPPEKGGK